MQGQTGTKNTENRQFWGQHLRDPYTSWGVKILTIPGQASSSKFCGSFGAEMDENGALNKGGDGCVMCDDKGATCLRLAMGQTERGEGEGRSLKAVATRLKETRKMQGKMREVMKMNDVRGTGIGSQGHGEDGGRRRAGDTFVKYRRHRGRARDEEPKISLQGQTQSLGGGACTARAGTNM
ncbi:hypothetical protein EDB86DRAFT_2824353 [Lactarius hatsudake]|nr:hypothetical protein EDB86DRAFT_2824353 [Lactarius hatsudake]